MKRLAVVVVLALLVPACTSLGKGGARGPRIDRTVDQPAQTDDAAQRELELGQR